MTLTRQPSFNIDKLEGAVEHMLMVCGALSDAALNDFAHRYAYQRGKKLPADYAKTKLLPRMKRGRKIYQTTYNLFSLNPMLKANKKGLDAFWVFLEYMEDVDIQSVMQGPYPSQISYIKNNRIYHIVPCSQEGAAEMGAAAMLEIELMQRTRRSSKKHAVEERFIFVFTSEEYMKKAAFKLNAPSLFCVIEYPDRTGIPKLSFVNPADLQ